MNPDTSLEQDIWSRQYAPADSPGETYPVGIDRVVDHVVKRSRVENIKYATYWRTMMKDKRFIPGGRILAGAGSAHGNLQNCFVQGLQTDSLHDRNILELAKNLALVTKVGGGNGINLDPLPPASDAGHRPFGELFITYDERYSEQDARDVATGTFLDQATGQRVTRGYRVAQTVATDFTGFDTYVSVEDSIKDIWDAAALVTVELSHGNRVLVDLSRLRPEGSPVAGGGTSSGPASFAVEVFDNFAYWMKIGGGHYAGPVAALRYVFAPTLRVIRQAGVRRGAGMATLSITHPDANDFITCKSLEREANEGDISTFNISLLVPDWVMTHYTHGTVDKYTSRLGNALKQAHATGEPGVLFVDRINEHNALAGVNGPILATNPCGEQPLYPGESCNLGAINVASGYYWTEEGDGFDWVRLDRDVHAAVRFLDAVHDADNSPLQSIRKATQDKRRLGLGMMGLADLLINLGLHYGSQEARDFATRLARRMTIAAIRASQKLAEELGPCPAWERAGTGYLPRRNIALMTVAPTGTTSMLAGVSSGVEPVYSATISRRIGTDYRTISHPLATMPAFVTAHELTPEQHVLMQAAVQRGYDEYGNGTRTYAGNAISKTINLPNSATVVDVGDALLTAYNAGSKGFTCYRDGSRALQVLTEVKQEDDEDEEDGESGELKDFLAFAEVVDALSEGFKNHPAHGPDYQDFEQLSRLGAMSEQRPVREPVINGKTYKYEVGDRKVYVTVNRDDSGRIAEVFINVSKPTDRERVAADIIGRLTSLSLKFGAPVEDVVQHLAGHTDGTGAFAKGLGYFGTIWEAVARALVGDTGTVLDVHDSGPEACPQCENGTLVHEGTCTTCHTCGWSKCS